MAVYDYIYTGVHNIPLRNQEKRRFYSSVNLNPASIRSVIVIVFERKQKGETRVIVPNWVAVLVAVVLILVAALIVVKYYPVIVFWLQ